VEIFLSALRQLGRDMRRQKLRTLLTALGVAWGTVALGLLLAFGSGLRVKMLSGLLRAGNNVVYAYMGRTYKSWEGMQKGRPLHLDDGDLEALRARTFNLEALSPRPSLPLKARWGEKTMDVDAAGVYPDYFTILRLPPLPGGRNLTAEDERERRKVAFLGWRAAEELTGSREASGREFLLADSVFTIVGVLDPEGQSGDEQGWDADLVLLPASTFRAITGLQETSAFLFRPRDVELHKETVQSVREVLAERLKFDPTDKRAIYFDDFTEYFRSVNAFMTALSLLLGCSGVLTLVAGGIGVSNIMGVVVEERTRETGIKMALGAKARFILAEFLFETLLLTAAGGLVGFAMIYLILAVFPKFGLEPYVGTPTLTPLLAVAIAAVLGCVGAAAGYGPASRAAAMDPVVAMKH